MSRTIATSDIAKGVPLESVRRTRRVVIEATPEGVYSLTAERETVALVNGVQVGAPSSSGIVTIGHADLVKHPNFAAVQKVISGAIDAAEGERDEAMAKSAADEAASANG